MPMKITCDCSTEEMAMLALSVHNALGGLPVAMKARYSTGILVEDGKLHVAHRDCSALESVFSGEGVKRIHIGEGRHTGSTMFISAIINGRGHRIAAIGVIDSLGVLSLGGFVADNDHVDRQLDGRRPCDKK